MHCLKKWVKTKQILSLIKLRYSKKLSDKSSAAGTIDCKNDQTRVEIIPTVNNSDTPKENERKLRTVITLSKRVSDLICKNMLSLMNYVFEPVPKQKIKCGGYLSGSNGHNPANVSF